MSYIDMARIGDNNVNIQEPSAAEKEGKEGDLRPTWGYATRKTFAKGLLNASLLMSNAAELKHLFDFRSEDRDGFWIADLVLILLSIVLQIVVAFLLLVLGFAKAKTKPHYDRIQKMNNSATGLVLCVTIINILITGFNIQLHEES